MPGMDGTHLGRYRLERRLGRGGMSEVYLATDELMHREVAIKVVSSTHTDYIERFQREAEAIGGLQHDHILPAFDFGEQPPWHYLVMPYISYCTLLDVLDNGPMSLGYAGELLQQIASALQYAHDHDVIHRDIKPSNILLRDDHYIYLADFGLAKPLGDSSKVTQTGVLLGTPEYMAPELADGPATRSSDLYALGILLYQMVTGKMPFTGDTPLSVYLKQMREQPLPPSRINPKIPHAIDLVVMRALEKDPRRRYDSAMALSDAYTHALEESEAHSSPSHPSRPSVYETEVLESALPHRDTPTPVRTPMLHPPSMEPMIPATARPQPEKLVLPPVNTPPPPVMRRQTPPVRNSNYARQTPVISSDYPLQRRVPARRSNRNSMFGLSVLIGLLFLVLLGVVFYAVANRSNSNNTHVPGNTPQPTTINHATVLPSPSTNPSPTAQPTPAIIPTATAVSGNTPLLQDTLSSNTNKAWNEDGISCAFQNGSYHVLVDQSNTLQACTNTNFTFSSGAVKVDLSLLKGSNAGLIFRFNGSQFYDFEINSQGQYFFRRHDANAGSTYASLIPPTSSPAIAQGSGTNTLYVLANGGNFAFFINGTFLKNIPDSNYSSGQIGFTAGTNPNVPGADASFSNLTVYPM